MDFTLKTMDFTPKTMDVRAGRPCLRTRATNNGRVGCRRGWVKIMNFVWKKGGIVYQKRGILCLKEWVLQGMNTMRIWGGGLFFYDAFYDAADEFGLMIYHDLMFIEQGHGPCCPFYGAWLCTKTDGMFTKIDRICTKNGGFCTKSEGCFTKKMHHAGAASGWSNAGHSYNASCDCAGESADTQHAELLHQLRRLSSHPSIVIW